MALFVFSLAVTKLTFTQRWHSLKNCDISIGSDHDIHGSQVMKYVPIAIQNNTCYYYTHLFGRCPCFWTWFQLGIDKY